MSRQYRRIAAPRLGRSRLLVSGESAPGGGKEPGMEVRMRADSVRPGQMIRWNAAVNEQAAPMYVWLYVMANLPDGDGTELLLAPSEDAPVTSHYMDDDTLVLAR